MPTWLLVVIAAHLLNAVAFVVDKFLLARAVPKPTAYAFFVGMLGAVAFVLLPFDWVVPTPGEAVLDVAAGATFVLALLAFFTALKRGEASRIVPYVGGTIPVWTLILAYAFLGERLAQRELLAFAVLVVGAALIARDPGHGASGGSKRFAYPYASVAAVCFAVSAVLMKAVFLQQSFLAGFAWSRVGSVLAALAILAHGPSRRAISAPQQRPHGKLAVLFTAGQVAGALGFLTIQYAISVASPTLVNALQGVQYAFLFLIAALLGRRFPQLRERLSSRIVSQKVLAIVVIGIGLAMLAQAQR